MRGDMKRPRALLVLLLPLFFVGCPSNDWISVAGIHRPAVAKGSVVYLDAPPKRPFELIGIITPPTGEYETEAEAVRAMLPLAAKHGADAIFIESQSESGGWQFSGMSGGSFSDLHIRAKAIVWK